MCVPRVCRNATPGRRRRHVVFVLPTVWLNPLSRPRALRHAASCRIGHPTTSRWREGAREARGAGFQATFSSPTPIPPLQHPPTHSRRPLATPSHRRPRRTATTAPRAAVESPPPPPPPNDAADAATRKFGLEAGLFSVWKSDADGATKKASAKALLKTYGSAYLVTSISFALVSFVACYAAVAAGVDVSSLLARVGLTVNATSEKVGTFAIAYAAHKALSPVRFPPTVALTPVVARWLGKAPVEGDKEE